MNSSGEGLGDKGGGGGCGMWTGIGTKIMPFAPIDFDQR